jgi:hypothetical protein
MAASQSRAWNPPDGPADRPDLAEKPATPTTLLKQAHGYIIQNGISILNNDGYWFAAQMLRQWQPQLLNGVRYADVYLGRQVITLNLCFFLGNGCFTLASDSWPLAADNHYFNPDTDRGLDPGTLQDLASWAEFLSQDILRYLDLGIAKPEFDIKPDLKDGYTSALQMFDEEYAHALNTYFETSAPSCGRSGDDHLVLCPDIRGRQGTALAMFYLGWASHLMQDQNVVHHTFDAFRKHHREYEAAADGLGTSPIANGEQQGIYEADLAQLARDIVIFPFGKDLPITLCNVDSQPLERTCFASYANYISHNASILDAIDNDDYYNVVKDFSIVEDAILRAQRLQAGLYAAFLTDIGLRPVHMSAVIAAL